MSFESCHIEYDLSRRQRLAAHLEVWTPLLFVVVLILGCSTALIAGLWLWVSPWFVLLSVVPLWLATPVLAQFLVGLVKVVFIASQHMDIIVEETALGFMARGERFWVFLDGITGIQKHSKDTWTILHHNGTVINIPVSAIDERYIDHMRTMAEKGRTPEGIQAKIERGRLIDALEAEERWERKEMKRQKRKEKQNT